MITRKENILIVATITDGRYGAVKNVLMQHLVPTTTRKELDLRRSL